MKKSSIVIIILIIVILIMYKIGTQDTIWTREKEQEAIHNCNKWGGDVIRDSTGNYLDCAINDRLQ